MKDYKLKQRKLRASHTPGVVLELEHKKYVEEKQKKPLFFKKKQKKPRKKNYQRREEGRKMVARLGGDVHRGLQEARNANHHESENGRQGRDLQSTYGDAVDSSSFSVSHSSWDALPREVEGLDISTYANLKHAFEIIVHSYTLQKEALEANRRRWSDERQDLLTHEQNLVEALTAVREALDAETAAHDKDLETLEKVVARNAELDRQLRVMQSQLLVESNHSSVGKSGVGAVAAANYEEGARTEPPLAMSGLSSSLRVLAGAPVQHRYDAEPDSYQLLVASPQAQGKGGPQAEERYRSSNTANLAKEVSLLRMAYADLQEKMETGRGVRRSHSEHAGDNAGSTSHNHAYKSPALNPPSFHIPNERNSMTQPNHSTLQPSTQRSTPTHAGGGLSSLSRVRPPNPEQISPANSNLPNMQTPSGAEGVVVGGGSATLQGGGYRLPPNGSIRTNPYAIGLRGHATSPTAATAGHARAAGSGKLGSGKLGATGQC